MSTLALVALAGLAIGAAFGALVQRTNFCAMGAISDWQASGDTRRLRAWLLAVAVAMLGGHALYFAGAVDLGKSFYLAPRLSWLGAILGGALFGFGMVFAGGCASRTVVRVGSGSLKSLFVFLVMGVVGYATARGILYPPRTVLDSVGTVDLAGAGLATQGLGDAVSSVLGGAPRLWRFGLAVAIGSALAAWCFRHARFRKSTRDIAAGLGLGALVIAGWIATGILGADEFDPQPAQSLNLVGPTGDTLQYLMTFTGAKLSFGIAVVGGILIGSAGAALASGTFRLEGFASREDMLNHLGGAALMGFGGVLAAGCTVGQGLTGVATLAIGSLLAMAGILAGGIAGVRVLIWRMERASLDKGI